MARVKPIRSAAHYVLTYLVFSIAVFLSSAITKRKQLRRTLSRQFSTSSSFRTPAKISSSVALKISLNDFEGSKDAVWVGGLRMLAGQSINKLNRKEFAYFGQVLLLLPTPNFGGKQASSSPKVSKWIHLDCCSCWQRFWRINGFDSWFRIRCLFRDQRFLIQIVHREWLGELHFFSLFELSITGLREGRLNLIDHNFVGLAKVQPQLLSILQYRSHIFALATMLKIEVAANLSASESVVCIFGKSGQFGSQRRRCILLISYDVFLVDSWMVWLGYSVSRDWTQGNICMQQVEQTDKIWVVRVDNAAPKTLLLGILSHDCSGFPSSYVNIFDSMKGFLLIVAILAICNGELVQVVTMFRHGGRYHINSVYDGSETKIDWG